MLSFILGLLDPFSSLNPDPLPLSHWYRIRIPNLTTRYRYTLIPGTTGHFKQYRYRYCWKSQNLKFPGIFRLITLKDKNSFKKKICIESSTSICKFQLYFLHIIHNKAFHEAAKSFDARFSKTFFLATNCTENSSHRSKEAMSDLESLADFLLVPQI
jgi:hypothetical protein